MRPIAHANSAARMKLMHRIYALAQPSNRHTSFDDVRKVAHDGLGARSALVACHDALKEVLQSVSLRKTRCLVLLALSGHLYASVQCPLLGVKRTSQGLAGMSANDS